MSGCACLGELVVGAGGLMRVPALPILPALLVLFACKNADSDGPRTNASSKEPTPAGPQVQAQGPNDAVTARDDAASKPRSDALPTVGLEEVVADLVAPTNLAVAPDGTMVVLEQAGMMYRVDDGELRPFGDVTDRIVKLDPSYDERGLLGLAFHPDYPKNRHVFAYYSAPLRSRAPPAYDHTNVLSRFTVGDDGVVQPKSEKKLLSVDWPAPNHDGGTILFGPDRMLYVSMGDGGNAADIGRGHPPAGNGQDWTTLMGSILRIDPDGGDPYGIPSDNPFVGDHPGADEIWAYGLRNVYSYSIDPKTGKMFAGDVGQDLVEEVNIIERGKNYGWSIKEGNLCFSAEDPHRPQDECKDVGVHGEPLVPPILTYSQLDSVVADRSDVHGISVIGGHVYRGSEIPGLEGAYVFGDWSRNQEVPEGVLMAARQGDDNWGVQQLPVQGVSGPHIGLYIRAFGQDNDGEVYVLTSEREGITGTTGVVWRLVAIKAG